MPLFLQWTKPTSGGNNTKKAWGTNPQIRFSVPKDDTHMFISLCQDDPRLLAGRDGIKMQDPLGFHICNTLAACLTPSDSCLDTSDRDDIGWCSGSANPASPRRIDGIRPKL